MDDAQVRHMVDRFLAWRLPDTFNPDCGISFKAIFNEGTPHPGKHAPVGTNLLDANQADAMVRHMIEGLPEDDASEAERLRTAIRSAISTLTSRRWNGLGSGQTVLSALNILDIATGGKGFVRDA